MNNPLIVPPRTTTVTLYPGGVEQQLDALMTQIDEARAAETSTRRMNAKSEAMRLAEEYDRLVDENEAQVVTVTLSEVPARQYREMQENHPPRKGNRRDEQLGFNEPDFLRSLVGASITEPKVTPEQFDQFVDGYTDDDEVYHPGVSEWNWKKLTTSAWALANTEPDLPKPRAVSLLRQMAERESRQRGGTE